MSLRSEYAQQYLDCLNWRRSADSMRAVFQHAEQSMHQQKSSSILQQKLNHRLIESLAASGPTDKELIEGCLAGEHEAWYSVTPTRVHHQGDKWKEGNRYDAEEALALMTLLDNALREVRLTDGAMVVC